jgi:hypothetical protein
VELKETASRRVLLRNRSRWVANLGASEHAKPCSFVVADAAAPRTIMPGAEIELDVTFTAKNAGDATDHIKVMSSDGAVFGAFDVKARAEHNESRVDEETGKLDEGANQPAPKEVGTTNKKVLDARGRAMNALFKWMPKATEVLDNTQKGLRDEWTEYLSKTGDNPFLAEGAVGGAGLLGKVIEHTIIAGVAKGPEEAVMHLLEHANHHWVEHVAAEVGESAAKHGGAAITGAEIGSALGPEGAMIGMVVGVMAEVAGDLIWGWLSGESGEEAKHAKEVKDAHDEGEAHGSRSAGARIKAKSAELAQSGAKAKASFNQSVFKYRELIGTSLDVKKLGHLEAELEGQLDLANAAKPQAGLAQHLLQLWVRDHAATTTKAAEDVNPQLWEQAKRDLEKGGDPRSNEDGLSLRAPLFVPQLLSEWEKRGLKPPPGLAEQLQREALDAWNNHKPAPGTTDYDAQKAKAVKERFNARVFQFNDVRLSQIDLTGSFIDREMSFDVTTRPVLGIDTARGFGKEAEVVLERTEYTTSSRRYVTTRKSYEPGQEAHRSQDETKEHREINPRQKEDPYASPVSDVSLDNSSLYRAMSVLESLGYDVWKDIDAADNEWLQTTFGDRVTIPVSQNVVGAPEVISVFRAKKTHEATISEDAFPQMAISGVSADLRYSMYRAGNVILVLEKPAT